MTATRNISTASSINHWLSNLIEGVGYLIPSTNKTNKPKISVTLKDPKIDALNIAGDFNRALEKLRLTMDDEQLLHIDSLIKKSQSSSFSIELIEDDNLRAELEHLDNIKRNWIKETQASEQAKKIEQR